ncbi:unnamed protein product [Agarophyton chilense]
MSAVQLDSFRTWLADWRFEPGLTPFSRWQWPVLAVVAYFTIIYALQRAMATKKPLDIPEFLFFHNFSLCMASFLLGLWLTYALATAHRSGLSPHEVLCSRRMYEDGHLQMIYYINMFYKVWEFVDTFLLALRKKPIAFLHAYHHAATLFLTWNQLIEHSSPQWVPIVINLWIHVLMYYYYAMSALRIRIWWKKHLTTLQILQFIVDVGAVGYAYTTFILSGFDENVCYGTTKGALVGLGILTSYLLLFIRFYMQTYKRTPVKGRSSPASDKAEEKKEQ